MKILCTLKSWTILAFLGLLLPFVSLRAQNCNTYASALNLNLSIPNENPAGVSSTINVPTSGTITELRCVTVNMTHTFTGDLVVTLTHINSGIAVQLFRRLNAVGATGFGENSNLDGSYTFCATGASFAAAGLPLNTSEIIPPGTYAQSSASAQVTPPQNTNTYASFTGLNAMGDWTLNIADYAFADVGTLRNWSFEVCTSNCPTFSSAPANVSITNSTCNNGIVSGGSITAPGGTPCPASSVLQYQVNSGSWSTILPTYNQSGPPQTISTRCACEFGAMTTSAASTPVTTVPGSCPPVVLNCPAPVTVAANQTQQAVEDAFTTWLNTASGSNGCNGMLSNDNTGAPPSTGGAVTITFTYTSTCAPLTTTCQSTFTVTAAAPNNECASSVLLTSGTACNPVSGTTINATQSLPPLQCGSLTAAQAYDVWYRFTATSPNHMVMVDGDENMDAVVQVFSGDCPGTPIACSDATNTGGTEIITLTGLTVGSIYRIRVYDFFVNSGDFTICVTTQPPSCIDSPVSPTNGQTGLCPSATTTLSWAAVTGATSYDVYFGAPGSLSFIANTSNTTFAANTASAGTYYWQIRPVGAGGTAVGCTVWSFTKASGAFTLPTNGATTVACPSLITEPTPPVVTTNCGSAVTRSGVTIVTTPDPLTCEGTRTYYWTYDNGFGQTETWSHTVTVDRNPFTVPTDGASTVACPALATPPATPTVMSNCGETLPTPTPVITNNPNPLTCEGTRTYAYTYMDCAGNTATWRYVYTIARNPFTVPVNGAATVNSVAQAVPPALPNVTSHCGETLTPGSPVITDSPNPIVCTGTRTYAYTYTDCKGNTATWRFVYTITDSQPPMVTCSNGTVTFNGQNTLALNAASLATATDNCGILSLTASPATINCSQIGQVIPVTITATDVNNNTATCTSNVTITGLPCGWAQNPDGVNCTAGNSISYNQATGVWTATSTGCYYASPYTADESSFAQRTLCGDGSITALVTGINGNVLGWAGVVMRESNAAGAKKAQLSTNRGTLSRREFRTTTDGQAFPQQFPSQNSYWLRIVRTGNQFALYTSSNGTAWSLAAAQNIVMSSCIQIGLTATNYTPNSTVTATFSNVSYTGGPATATLADAGNETIVGKGLQLSVYPNPTSGNLTLSVNGAMDHNELQLEVVDALGRVLHKATLPEGPAFIYPLDLSSEQAGIYYLHLRSANGVKNVQRIVIQQ